MFDVEVYVDDRRYMRTTIDASIDHTKPMKFIAAAPFDRRYSYSGSGLPFTTYKQAFDSTPNQGVVESSSSSSYQIRLKDMPNSFYVNGMKSLVPPTLYLDFTDPKGEAREHCVKLCRPLPGKRMHFSAARNALGPAYYRDPLFRSVKSQEEILMKKAHKVPAIPKSPP
jgi:hypothetical protein